MLLTAIAALLGAYLGLNSRSRAMAALIAAAIAGAAHYVLLYGSAIVLAFASDPLVVDALFTAVGVRGFGLTYGMGAAASAALVSGILLAFADSREGREGYARRGPSEELSRIGNILSG